MDRIRLWHWKLLLLLRLACLQAVVCDTFLQSCDVGDDGLPQYFSLDDDITYANNADIIEYISLNSIKFFNVSIDGVSLLRTYMGHFATVTNFSEQKCIGAILLQASINFISVSGKFNEMTGEYEHDCGGCAEQGMRLPPDDSTVIGDDAFWSFAALPSGNDKDIFVALGEATFGRAADTAYSNRIGNSFSNRVFLVEFEPVCINFDDFIINAVEHGSTSCTRVLPSSTCDVLCATGFHMASGNSTFMCDPSKEPQWIGDASCQPTVCQPFDQWINVNNSVSACTRVDHDSTCDISCDIGFSLESVGTERYRCDPVSAPDWMQSEAGPAVCSETLCHQFDQWINVSNSASACDRVHHDSVCDISCDIGFSLESVGTDKYTCDPAHAPEWTSSELGSAVCEKTLCHQFAQWIEVGNASSRCELVDHHSVCDVSCDIGFSLKNGDTEKYTCDPVNAPEWTSGELGPAVCEKTLCHNFQVWLNVSNAGSTCESVEQGATCAVSCAPGYALTTQGSELYTCDPKIAPEWKHSDAGEAVCTRVPAPTPMPTYMPTPMPTFMLTLMPTLMPSLMPTSKPTSLHTPVYTLAPTSMTTLAPTSAPHFGNSSGNPTSETTESFVQQIFNEDRVLSFTMIGTTVFILCAYFASRYMESSVKRVLKKQSHDADVETANTRQSATNDHARTLHGGLQRMETLNMLKKSGNHFYILLAALALVDFATDWFFVVERFQGVDADGVPHLSVLSAVFLGVPMLGNAAFIVLFLYIEFASEEVSDWFFDNSSIATIVAIIALGNPDILLLFISLCFGCLRPGSVFNAPFSDRGRELLYVAGGIANVFEDIPQIGIQVAVIGREGASVLTIIALATSVVTLLFGVVRRFFLCIMFCRRREARLVSRERSVAASEAAASRVGGDMAAEMAIFHQTGPRMFPLRTFPTTSASPENEAPFPEAPTHIIPLKHLLAEQNFTIVTTSPHQAYLQAQAGETANAEISDLMQSEMKVANADNFETAPHAFVASREHSVGSASGVLEFESKGGIDIESRIEEPTEVSTHSKNDNEMENLEV